MYRLLQTGLDLGVGALYWMPAMALALVLGQTIPDGVGIEGVKIDFSSMTATGILGWYAWHTVSRTIPSMMAAFREETKEVRLSYAETTKQQRESYERELKEQREHFLAELKEARVDYFRRPAA